MSPRNRSRLYAFTIAIAAAAALCVSAPLRASPITYTIAVADASGTLGGSSFLSATVTITLTGDTSSVSGGFSNQITAEADVAGIGTATLTSSFLLLERHGSTALDIIDPSITFFLVEISDPAFASYDLASALGPLSIGPGSTETPGINYPTTLGNLELNNNDGATFTASTTTAATPIPAALPLFATGIGGLGLLGWRRKRKAKAVA